MPIIHYMLPRPLFQIDDGKSNLSSSDLNLYNIHRDRTGNEL